MLIYYSFSKIESSFIDYVDFNLWNMYALPRFTNYPQSYYPVHLILLFNYLTIVFMK